MDRRNEGGSAWTVRGDQVVLQGRPRADAERLFLLERGSGLAARRVERPHEAAAFAGLQGRHAARRRRCAESGRGTRFPRHLCAAPDREIPHSDRRWLGPAQGPVLPRGHPGRGRARGRAQPPRGDGRAGRVDRLSLSGIADRRPAPATRRRRGIGAEGPEHGRCDRRSRSGLPAAAGEDPRHARSVRRRERA